MNVPNQGGARARARAREGWPLAARVWWALVVANVRYWTGVAPIVRSELRRWRRRAQEMPNGPNRDLAMEKLREEAFNAEVAATLATLAPRARRADAVRAIVALEVLYDYMDGVSERGSQESDVAEISEAERALVSFADDREGGGGYELALATAVRDALSGMPEWRSVEEIALRTVRSCARAQDRIHAIPELGVTQARAWAEEETKATGLAWREFLAGAASSVLAAHALIAFAADDTAAPAYAEEIIAAYLPICAVITLLDGVVDREADARSGAPAGVLSVYEDQSELVSVLPALAREGVRRASSLPHGAHHVMTLAGAVAYWTTAPGASSGLAGEVSARLRRELSPAIWPAVAVMRAWRVAKAMRRSHSG